MTLIAGVHVPLNKRVEVGLTYIYGIGRSTSRKILYEAGISLDTYVRDLTDAEITRVRSIIDENYLVEGDLRRMRVENVRRLMAIGCYRGLRHRQALPVRGQNTKTNARTKKGRRIDSKNKSRKTAMSVAT